MSPAQFDAVVKVVKLVCAHFHLTPDQLESSSRRQEFVWPRYIAISLIRHRTHLNLNTVGILFNRSPYLVLHAARAVETSVQTNRARAREVALISQQLDTLLSPPQYEI